VNAQRPKSDAEIAARIDARLRRAEVRSWVIAALRAAERPLRSRELRERALVELGGSRRRVAADVSAALRSLKYRQLAHNEGSGWLPGSPDTSRRRHPLSVRGPCPDCGQLHLSSAPCPKP
jgi:hypothetical protein